MGVSDESCLIGGVEQRPIVVVDYDPAWALIFQRQARVIAEALGQTALRIEHIGSTAVPGLAAKPIVDILVVTPDAADEDAYLPALVAVGYALRVREPEFYEHRMLRTVERDVQVHVYGPKSPEIGRYLAFRDRLRTSADDRLRYEAVKRELARQSWRDVNAYARAKTDVIEGILRGAGGDFGVGSEIG